MTPLPKGLWMRVHQSVLKLTIKLSTNITTTTATITSSNNNNNSCSSKHDKLLCMFDAK